MTRVLTYASEQGDARIATAVEGAGYTLCPQCDTELDNAWAHDGESPAADYWECPPCGACGAFLLDGHDDVSANGVPLDDGYHVVTLLQACEPDALPAVDGVTVYVTNEIAWGSARCPYASVVSRDRDALLDYVRLAWGDDDAEWFTTWVARRVTTSGGGFDS